MTTAVLDEIASIRSYAGLVNRFPPRLIREQALLKKTYKVIDRLMAIEHPSADQLDFLELLSTLVEDYESVASPTPAPSLAALLEHLIEAKGATQTTVAKEAGVSPSTISDVLASRRSLSIANIKRLSHYFCVDASLFVHATA